MAIKRFIRSRSAKELFYKLIENVGRLLFSLNINKQTESLAKGFPVYHVSPKVTLVYVCTLHNVFSYSYLVYSQNNTHISVIYYLSFCIVYKSLMNYVQYIELLTEQFYSYPVVNSYLIFDLESRSVKTKIGGIIYLTALAIHSLYDFFYFNI